MIHVEDICRPLDFEPDLPIEVEVGCGKGRFLTARAAAHPERQFLGIERMLDRARAFDAKVARLGAQHARVLRLEALYTFWYLLPPHQLERVYVFFPDPWPKRKHHSHRLFGPLFLTALWKRLAPGGRLEFATDHEEYFHTVEECFASGTCHGEPAAARFARVEPMARPPEVWTEFETKFRAQGLPIYTAAWEAKAGPDYELGALTVPPEDEPREGIERRVSKRDQAREEAEA